MRLTTNDLTTEGAARVRATLQPGLTNRLTKYLRTTQQLIEEGRDAVSSKELGDFTGINPVQVRRDLNAIGFSGTRGVGYQAYDLVERSEEHTSELQSRQYLVCRLLLEKKKINHIQPHHSY